MKLILSALTIWTVFISQAQSSAIAHIDTLISLGNHAYELSQPTKIKQCADSIALIINSGALYGDALKDYSVSMLKLYGNYHYVKSDLDSAFYYYDRAQTIIDENPNTSFNGKGVLLMLRELAQLYYRKGDYPKALEVMEQANYVIEYDHPYEIGDNNWLISKLTYAICLARMKQFDEAIEIAESELKNALDKENLNFAKAQRMYAKIQLLANAGREGALNAYKSYFFTQKKYAREHFANMNSSEREEYWFTLQPFITDCYLLEAADPGFLYDITLFSKGLLLQLSRLSGNGKARESALKTLDYKWQDIQHRLCKTDMAVEFIQYGEGDIQKMAALVLKSTGKPQFIHLTSPDCVIKYAGDNLKSTQRRDKDNLYTDSTLQTMIWTPDLLKTTRGIKRLYFAPDGYIHRLAIEYMPQVENIDVCRLTSTRRLMEEKTNYSPISSLLAFGAINYNWDSVKGEPVANDQLAFENYIGKSFPNLNASTDETKEILANRNNPNDMEITGTEASEFTFRQLSPGYSSILLSTHGDFCAIAPVPTDLKPVEVGETLSRSIIAFSGINSRLRNSSFDATTHCDGLLSARELSDLDLSNCKLFTASACQSGIGEISSDGVFGFQRGLKNAGVDAMLLSLWNVNSEASFILMKEFYHNLDLGMSIRKAFTEARKRLLSDTPVENIEYVFDPAIMAYRTVKTIGKLFNTPQYTNAFILIDALD